MRQMKAAYPAQEITSDTAEVWTPLWMAQITRYGMDAFRRALLDHMASSRFLPHPAELTERLEAMRPARVAVFVPTTRAEVRRLCGPAVAEGVSEISVDDCARMYGAESARLYREKLGNERRSNGRVERQ
jgi:hypothetical protein